jgi:hypothetical protein
MDEPSVELNNAPETINNGGHGEFNTKKGM